MPVQRDPERLRAREVIEEMVQQASAAGLGLRYTDIEKRIRDDAPNIDKKVLRATMNWLLRNGRVHAVGPSGSRNIAYHSGPGDKEIDRS